MKSPRKFESKAIRYESFGNKFVQSCMNLQKHLENISLCDENSAKLSSLLFDKSLGLDAWWNSEATGPNFVGLSMMIVTG